MEIKIEIPYGNKKIDIFRHIDLLFSKEKEKDKFN